MKIKREKPNFNELIKNYKLVDMHLHSCYSPDSSTKIKDIVETANKRKIGIAITDHNEIKGCLEASKYDIFLIPGIEITCKEGCHILVYFYNINELKDFYNKNIKNNLINNMRTRLSHKDLINLSRKYKCILSAAHPFGGGKSGLYKIKHYKDLKIIEGLNARTFPHMNKKALKLNKIFTGGSDSHIKNHIGKVVTCSKAKNIKEFLDNIKKNKNFVIGKELNIVIKSYGILKTELSLIKKMKLNDYLKNRLINIK